MSLIHEGRLVLCGTDSEAVDGFSLRFEFHSETSNKFALFEFVGEVDGKTKSPADRPDGPWDVFWCYAKILKKPNGKEATRKVLIAGATFQEALEKIRDVVRRECKGYVAVHPPTWWVPDEAPELLQIAPMLARGISDEAQLEKMMELYDNDDYIAELKYDGHRAKAHFYANGPSPLIRFDSRRQSDTTGLFSENTEQVPHLAGAGFGWHFQNWVREYHGTILDGEIIHPNGVYAVASVMGALGKKAMQFQQDQGWVRFMVFDCLAFKGELIVNWPWEKRRTLVDDLVEEWKKIIGLENTDPNGPLFVEAVPFWRDGKRSVRRWAFDNGWEGMILKKADSKYSVNARTWDWVKDKREKRFSCVVSGFENSESEAYGPKGWIKCVKVSQYLSGSLIEVAAVGSMDVETRKWFSENRMAAMGRVVEIEAQEQNKKSHQLRHPRFIAFRTDKAPADCTVGQDG